MHNAFCLNYLFDSHSNPARKVLEPQILWAQRLSVLVKAAFLGNPQDLGFKPKPSWPFQVNYLINGGMYTPSHPDILGGKESCNSLSRGVSCASSYAASVQCYSSNNGLFALNVPPFPISNHRREVRQLHVWLSHSLCPLGHSSLELYKLLSKMVV